MDSPSQQSARPHGRALARPIELTPLELTAPVVTDVHAHGGTILGSSRGPQDVATMLDTLVRDGVSILFCIGGDGTLRGASAIAGEAIRREPAWP